MGQFQIIGGMMEVSDMQTTTVTYSYNGWNAKKIGKSRIYEREIVYAGAPGPITYSLVLETSGQLNRIEQLWNDATAKDATITIRNTPNAAYSASLQALAGNTSTSEVLQLGDEYKYSIGATLTFSYANYTNAKIVRVIVQVDEI